MMNVTIIPVGMLGTNCYLLADEDKNCAVIDPGAQPEKVIDLIGKGGLRPQMVLLTHGHHDHIGGVKKILAQYPGIKLYIGEKDQEMLTDPDKSYASSRGRDVEEFILPDSVAVKENDELPLGGSAIRVIDAPGHTKGGVCYLCGDLLFAGDTLFHSNIGRCDLYGGDYDVMLATLKKLAGLKGDYTVYPGHGESTTLDFERGHNHYIREALQ